MIGQDLARILVMKRNDGEYLSPQFPDIDDPLPGNLHYFEYLKIMPPELRNEIVIFPFAKPNGPCTVLSDHTILNMIKMKLKHVPISGNDHIMWIEWDRRGACFYSSSRQTDDKVIKSIQSAMYNWSRFRYRK